jgi:hypothetical protein
MGGIGGMFGASGGAAGTGFAAPRGANLYNPVTKEQITDAYGNVTNSMESQKSLLAALQAQNGIQNQSQVYNQLQGVVAGTGPNPAQAMLNQATGQNVANQAALMAAQRGAGSNVGLIARQAAQQGANTQQQAVGQGASMQAQQSLNALGQAGGVANTQTANQIGQTNANVSAQQAEQANLLNAQAQFNNAQMGMQSNINNNNSGLIQSQLGAQQSMVGGLINGAGAMFAGGGEVADPSFGFADPNAPQSKFGQFLKGMSSAPMDSAQDQSGPASMGSNKALNKGTSNLVSKIGGKFGGVGGAQSTAMAGGAEAGSIAPMAMVAAIGGKVPALVSPGEKYLKPQEAKAVATGQASPGEVGSTVPGTPKYKGNNYANDTVPTELDEGGVVIPNSVMQSKDPVGGAAKFVRACLAKKSMKK